MSLLARTHEPAEPARPATVSDIESAWKKTRAEFEKHWKTRRWGPKRKIIYVIHDAPAAPLPAKTSVIPYLGPDEATNIVSEILAAPANAPIDVILHTFGGDASATEMVAEALVARKAETTAYVPHYAMSAGTEIALACKQIVLGKHASLGPTDLQIGGFPARDYEALVKEKGLKGLEDRTALIAMLAQRAAKKDPVKMNALINRMHKRVSTSWFKRHEVKESLAEKLTSGVMEHGHRINLKEARDLGIRAIEEHVKPVVALVEARRAQLAQIRKLEWQ